MEEGREYKVSIKSLRLENFRAFSKIEKLDFNERLTVFIGINGSGKTSILDAVAAHLRRLVHSVFLQDAASEEDNYLLGELDVRNGAREAQTHLSYLFSYPKNIYGVKSSDSDIDLGTYGVEDSESPEDLVEEEEPDFPEDLLEEEDSDFLEGLLEEEDSDFPEDLSRELVIAGIEYETKEASASIFLMTKGAIALNYPVDEDREKKLLKLGGGKGIAAFGKLFKKEFNVEEPSHCLPVFVYYGCNSISINVEENSPRIAKNDRLNEVYKNALNPKRFNFNDFFEWFELRQKTLNQTEARLLSQWQENMLETLKTGEIGGVPNEELLAEYSQLLKDMSNKEIDTKELREINLVKSALITFFSDEEDGEYFQNIYIDYSSKEGVRMLLEKRGEDKPLSVEQMSSGEKSLFGLVADLCRRLIAANPGLDNPLEGQGVVLIDEVELHLHPKWQKMVLNKLMSLFPNIQFVVSTHSFLSVTHLGLLQENMELEDVSATLKTISVYKIGKDDEGATLLKKIEHFLGRQVHDILYSYYQQGKRPALFRKKINELFDYLDDDELEKAKKLMAELLPILGKEDAAMFEAKTYIEDLSN